jgi:hypothetical protein
MQHRARLIELFRQRALKFGDFTLASGKKASYYLDGKQIMDLLGIAPGPVVGEAYQFLLDLRLDRGPMTKDDAIAALHAWWSAR